MGLRNGHQLHVRISEDCYCRLERIAGAEGTDVIEPVRRLLLARVRGHTSRADEQSTITSKQILGT